MSEAPHFQPGDVVLHRQVWHGLPWLTIPVEVVEDTPSLVALHIPTGAPFGCHDDHPLGEHPWRGRGAWTGHGVLMLQRPDEAHAVFVFWEGEARAFAGWYVNLQEPFRRRPFGFDTQDQELDLWLPASGGIRWKDVELLDERVRRGRYSEAEAAAVRAEAERVAARWQRGEQWWDDRWKAWLPAPRAAPPSLPAGWRELG